MGTEPGKVRPVLVLQTDVLNNEHPSTIICPLSSHLRPGVRWLRVHLKKGEAGLAHDSDILVDQIRAIDNRRLLKLIGWAPDHVLQQTLEGLAILLDFEKVEAP
ncbi:MAG: type II toxin-antitoxin system PemK/MazF family toxin [Elusimicrobia bacterium]|nr:type II toxin-antitoxin system PemK/MazF family toxin [Elusimicrobiota bacterium]